MEGSSMTNRYLVGMITVAMVALIGQTAFAKLPSWDTVNNNPVRFKVLNQFNGEAVRDVETGLVWERSPSSTAGDWFAANDTCIRKVINNRMGWRVPTIQDLTSLVDPSTTNPSLPNNHPFENVGGVVWTATTNAANSNEAWEVNFITGNTDVLSKLSTIPSAWCVRGETGSGVDAQ
jgi:hypothetical protein